MRNDEVFTTWITNLDDLPVAVVYLCGELDASSVPALLGDLYEVINGYRSIMFDAHLLSYIDNTGLSALASIKQAAQNRGRGVCIVGAHGLLEKILSAPSADVEFKRYQTTEEAMAEVKTPGW
ncbi:MAG: STAS domain-containing protein [Armatimonadota bacterium]